MLQGGLHNEKSGKKEGKRDLEKDINYFFELLKIMKHFFKEMENWLRRVND